MRRQKLASLTLILLASVSIAACGKKEKAAAPVPAAPAAAAPAAPTAEEIAAESQRINDWFNAKYEEQLAFSPIQRTFLGDKKDYDKIDDLSEAGEDAQLYACGKARACASCCQGTGGNQRGRSQARGGLGPTRRDVSRPG